MWSSLLKVNTAVFGTPVGWVRRGWDKEGGGKGGRTGFRLFLNFFLAFVEEEELESGGGEVVSFMYVAQGMVDMRQSRKLERLRCPGVYTGCW